VELLLEFIQSYEGRDNVFGDENKSDELRPLLATVSSPSASIPVETDILLARMMKILLRKSANRLALGKNGIQSIIRSLSRIQAEKNIIALAEMCNVVLNTCYDSVNVLFLIELGGVTPLLSFLKTSDVPVLSSALGALQGLCYVPSGRQCIRTDIKALRRIATFLVAEESVIRARAVGVVHNLSVDIVSINCIVETGCIPALVRLLRDSSAEICRAAAGTIQNISRDIVARAAIVETGALDYLSDLLFASDVACQIAAVGTILNIVGSSLETEEERKVLNQMLTDGLVVGALRSSIFDTGDSS